MDTWKCVVSLGTICSPGIGFLEEAGKGLRREFSQITKGTCDFILQARAWGALEVLNCGVLKSFNKITLKPR